VGVGGPLLRTGNGSANPCWGSENAPVRVVGDYVIQRLGRLRWGSYPPGSPGPASSRPPRVFPIEMTINRLFRGQLEYAVIMVLATVLILAVLMVLGTQARAF
jgi:hypothetical protein